MALTYSFEGALDLDPVAALQWLAPELSVDQVIRLSYGVQHSRSRPLVRPNSASRRSRMRLAFVRCSGSAFGLTQMRPMTTT